MNICGDSAAWYLGNHKFQVLVILSTRRDGVGPILGLPCQLILGNLKLNILAWLESNPLVWGEDLQAQPFDVRGQIFEFFQLDLKFLDQEEFLRNLYPDVALYLDLAGEPHLFLYLIGRQIRRFSG